MKKAIFIITMALMTILFISCETESGSEPQLDISLLETRLGGCHGQDSGTEKSALKESKDTIVFTVNNDTLDVFLGVNYICCAPFTSNLSISQDSLIVTLTDVCNVPEEMCYCKCMCYYTWNFLFTDIAEQQYFYKIILINPREEEPIILWEGRVDL